MAPLSYRIGAAPDLPLFARAPSALEESTALEGHGDDPEAARAAAPLAIIAACLWTAQGRAFASAEEAGGLDASEADKLADEIAGALNRIAPRYDRSDAAAWRTVLEKGGKHPSNIATVFAMATCIDPAVSVGRNGLMVGRTPRPDRYWGVPVCELLDGHWMVFRAAQRVAEALRGG